MEKHALYGKRKKKNTICPNPLFVQWLTEWKESAVEKGMKTQYTFGKALKALQKFPLKLNSGRDCKILENFGDKICKMLDDRLAEHVAQHGTKDPVVIDSDPDNTDVDQCHSKLVPSVPADEHHKLIPRVPADQTEKVLHATDRSVHELSNSDDEISDAPPKKCKQSTGKDDMNEYIPVYRSGPYALLLTLYKDQQSANSTGYLSKSDLTRLAQPLADKSFTVPESNCRYTAWSSMRSLIAKGLVSKERSPARYSLTAAGCVLASKMAAVKESTCNKDLATFSTGDYWDVTEAVVSDTFNADDQAMTEVGHFMSDSGSVIDELNVSKLKYWYITHDGQEVLEKDKAVVTIDGDIGAGFLVKCSYKELLQSNIKYKIDTTRPQVDDYIYVYMDNSAAEDISMPPAITFPTVPGQNVSQCKVISQITNKQKERKGKKPKKIQASNCATPQLLPLIQRIVKHGNQDGSYQQKAEATVLKSDSVCLDSLPYTSVQNSVSSSIFGSSNGATSGSALLSSINNQEKSYEDKLPDCEFIEHVNEKFIDTMLESHVSRELQVSRESQDSCSQNSIKSLSSVSSEVSTKSFPPPDFVLHPGKFEIILCVDNAEFYGGCKDNSKTLFPDLIKNGITCELRKLHVGDFLWIAREKYRPIPGVLTRPVGRELVLDYIIERKRMDDLVSSCSDGRFREQKFRLKKCGLQHPMYLVEEYGSMQHFRIAESTINQAITNTQVIDGFQVKRTKDIKETIAFLTVFTRYLQSNFMTKTLYASSLDEIKECSAVHGINDLQQILPTFEEFNNRSIKSKALTIQEMFGKQLIQLHRMSAEKARAVIDRFPTVSSLFEAYEKCSSDKEKELLVATIKSGKSARCLGQAQSKQIFQLYNTENLV